MGDLVQAEATSDSLYLRVVDGDGIERKLESAAGLRLECVSHATHPTFHFSL